ncbi:MAG: ComEA family DNA-binding protein [Oscillospiraceae bacterium]
MHRKLSDTQKFKAVFILFVIIMSVSLLFLHTPIIASYIPASAEPFYTDKQDLININTACAEELCVLRGIGTAKSSAIVEYRMQNGDYKNVDDLLKVDGINEKLFLQIKSKICTERA